MSNKTAEEYENMLAQKISEIAQLEKMVGSTEKSFREAAADNDKLRKIIKDLDFKIHEHDKEVSSLQHELSLYRDAIVKMAISL